VCALKIASYVGGAEDGFAAFQATKGGGRAQAGATAANRSGNGDSLSLRSEEQEIKVIDARRAQNLSIAVKKLGKVSPAEVAASVEHCDLSFLTDERVELLTRLSLEPDETAALVAAEATRAGRKWRPLEAHLFALSGVPRLGAKLRALAVHHGARWTLQQAAADVQCVTAALVELRASGALVEMLHVALHLSNFMNCGSNRQARAIQLKTLEKFPTIKGKTEKPAMLLSAAAPQMTAAATAAEAAEATRESYQGDLSQDPRSALPPHVTKSLMHYLAFVCGHVAPGALLLGSELSALEKACAVDLGAFESGHKELAHALRSAKREAAAWERDVAKAGPRALPPKPPPAGAVAAASVLPPKPSPPLGGKAFPSKPLPPPRAAVGSLRASIGSLRASAMGAPESGAAAGGTLADVVAMLASCDAALQGCLAAKAQMEAMGASVLAWLGEAPDKRPAAAAAAAAGAAAGGDVVGGGGDAPEIFAPPPPPGSAEGNVQDLLATALNVTRAFDSALADNAAAEAAKAKALAKAAEEEAARLKRQAARELAEAAAAKGGGKEGGGNAARNRWGKVAKHTGSAARVMRAGNRVSVGGRFAPGTGTGRTLEGGGGLFGALTKMRMGMKGGGDNSSSDDDDMWGGSDDDSDSDAGD